MMASVKYYEYIVVGCGGIGSAAVYWLSRRCPNGVLGLEQFELGHDNGGSQDHSRIIRLNYDEDKYTKLVRDTYTAWEEVERESGLQILHKCGTVNFGPTTNDVLDSYAKSMAAQGIAYEQLSGPQLRKKFPQFTVGEETHALYQKDGGLVDAALGNSTHIQLAQSHGATILQNCPVTRIAPIDDMFTMVYTTKGVFKCRRLIITAGAWINEVLGSVGAHVPVYVTQEQVTYYATPNIKEFTKERYPSWIYHGDEQDLYGLPIHVNSGSKIGIDAGGPFVTPSTRTFIPDPKREKACTEFLQKNIPRSLGPIMYSKTCLYTMTPDRDFVIDTLAYKGVPQVIVCCGAGHAYKFASLLGKILSELAVDSKTKHDLSGFKINRPALTNPNQKPAFRRGDEKHRDIAKKPLAKL